MCVFPTWLSCQSCFWKIGNLKHFFLGLSALSRFQLQQQKGGKNKTKHSLGEINSARRKSWCGLITLFICQERFCQDSPEYKEIMKVCLEWLHWKEVENDKSCLYFVFLDEWDVFRSTLWLRHSCALLHCPQALCIYLYLASQLCKPHITRCSRSNGCFLLSPWSNLDVLWTKVVG